MRRLAILMIIAVALACGSASAEDIQVCFSPPLPSGCDATQTIVGAITAAQHQILVQAYSFSSEPIVKAIVDARRRGLDVRVILDKSNAHNSYPAATSLERAGVPVLIDSSHALAHNKVMIIDGAIAITGSFNFNKASESQNAENLVLIHNPDIAKLYIENWDKHAAHSQSVKSMGGKFPRATAGGDDADGDERPATPAGPIVGDRRSHIYAWPGCVSYDVMKPENRVVFANARAADAAGYKPDDSCP